jgi:hypothetical protein
MGKRYHQRYDLVVLSDLEAYIWQSSQPVIETLWRNWVITLSSVPIILLLEHIKTEQKYYTDWLDQ